MFKRFSHTFLLAFLVLAFSHLMHAQDPKKLADDLILKGFEAGKVGKYQESLEYFKQAQKLSPQNPNVYQGLGLALQNLGQIKDSIENLIKADRLLPNDPNVKYNLCLSLAMNKEYTKAIVQCEKSLNLNSDWVNPRVLLAEVLQRASRLDEAIVILQEALVKFPNDEKLLYLLGRSYAARSDFADSLKILEKLVQVNPKASAYRVALSEAYLRFDRIDEAEATALEAIELDVQNPSFSVLQVGESVL